VVRNVPLVVLPTYVPGSAASTSALTKIDTGTCPRLTRTAK
jgi:hypothetical protein